ncbi:LysR family transcriptional regulator [Lujinxingia litoralis]|uniref:LysR family transcriptional regulator n=1 Tax=Lujinxingia litoralis TaxID=2211119 RepID=A0A328C7Q4_9DELT|nr:LysR family transcriptional regulator [Lujinxingia litoralis]RAL20585.1 LysR family transcriptional regulator [Lujinxingia litoralis]
MFDWESVRYFLAAYETRSFTKAARLLSVEQSTVSRRIAEMERVLDVALFERTSQGLVPTEAAARISGDAEEMARRSRRIQDQAQDLRAQVGGLVRIATTEALAVFVLSRVLPGLSEHHPHLRFEILTGYPSVDLMRREADLALRFERPHRGEYAVQRVAQLPTAVLGLERWRHVAPDALPWIDVSMPGFSPSEEAWRKTHVGTPARWTTNSYLMQAELVRQGQGVALMTQSLSTIYPELVPLELDLPPAPVMDLYLVAPLSIRNLPRIDAVWRAIEGLDTLFSP